MVEHYLLVFLFFLGVVLGLVGSLAGVGGGVIFTPLMLAFSEIHPDYVRATGLAVALTTASIGGARYLEEGIADVKIGAFFASLAVVGSTIGALSGIYITSNLGNTGKALIRLALGLLLIFIVFIMAYRRIDHPPYREDSLAKRLGLCGGYHDVVLTTRVYYCVQHIAPTALSIFLIGLMGGMFGLGGGWAVVPALNLIGKVPLRAAVGISLVVLAPSSAAALAIYVNSKALPIVLVSSIVPGVILGANFGARLGAKAKIRVIRLSVLGVMSVAALQLIIRGLAEL
ncbi:MAG: sulfite exporter TauE/SafE family protein [Pyrobaculum sp.]